MRPAILLIASAFLFQIAAAQLKDNLIVHFAFNKAELDPAARQQLDSLTHSNRDHFRIRSITISAHCDSVGSNAYNDGLSYRRAASVKQYFLANGVNDSTFSLIRGFGKRKPLNQNATEEDRFLNRRVEIELLKDSLPIIASTTTMSPKNEERKLAEVIMDTATREGTTIILRNLNFEGGRHILLSSAQPVLDELLEAIQTHPKLKIEIQGHVCCTFFGQDGRDNDLGTYDLSWRRAKAIYDYLVDHNISADRLSYRGFGGTRKLYPLERNEYEQEQNRRVELRILDK